MALTPTEGQAMVAAVAASIRAEHPGFPEYHFKKAAGDKYYYEAASSKTCILSSDGTHAKKKVSFFTINVEDRTNVTLCCWGQKCAPKRYSVPGTTTTVPVGLPVYQSDVVLQTYGLGIAESMCCTDKFHEMTGPNAYSFPDLVVLSEGVTGPCCSHFHGHVKDVIAELERQETLCMCCSKVPNDCAFKMFSQNKATVMWDCVLAMPAD